VILANFLDELVLRQSLGMVIDVEALGLKGDNGILTDVLKEQEAQVLVFDRMKDLRLADRGVVTEGSATHEFVEGRVGRRDRDCVLHGGRLRRLRDDNGSNHGE